MRALITASSAALFFIDLALLDRLKDVSEKAVIGVLAFATLALILETQTKE